MKHKLCAPLLLATSLGVVPGVQAHVGLTGDKPYAGSRYLVTANVGHGCESAQGGEHLDTVRIEIDIPAAFTSVRPMDATFGPATIETDANGNVTRLVWTKAAAALAGDTHFYQVSFHGVLPDTPLATLAFVTTQICPDNRTLVWEGVDAPKLRVLPKRAPGWNKYTAQSDINEATIKAFFSDAQIVWSGGMAYSPNPVTAGLIVTPLTFIPVGTDYWVKY